METKERLNMFLTGTSFIVTHNNIQNSEESWEVSYIQKLVHEL